MTVLYIFLAILVLLLMVTIHELGHYIAGVVLKFDITEFAIGFGPVIAIPRFWDKDAMKRIADRKAQKKDENNIAQLPKEIRKDYLFRLQWQNKRGENISFRWFPLGGFCSFADDDGSEKQATKKMDDEQTVVGGNEKVVTGGNEKAVIDGNEKIVARGKFRKGYIEQSAWKRLIVQGMGPIFNIVSSFIFCMILIGAVGYGVPIVGSVLSSDSQQPVVTSVVYQVTEKENAVMPGDTIVGVGGDKITAADSYAYLVEKHYRDKSGNFTFGDNYILTVERKIKNEIKTIDVHGMFKYYNYTVKDKDGLEKIEKRVGMGIQFDADAIKMRKHNFGTTIGYSFPYAFRMSKELLKEFGKIFSGKTSIKNLAGPITTISSMGQAFSQDIRFLLVLLPFIAINLGIFNLLPIPSLDGARMVFTLIEMVFRKPVPRPLEAKIHAIGIVILLAFVIIVDITHFLL